MLTAPPPRETGFSAFIGNGAVSLGAGPLLTITELTGSIALLACFATGLGLDLDTLDFLQMAVFE